LKAIKSGVSEARIAETLNVNIASIREKRDLLQEVQETRENMQEALEELEASSREIEQQIRALHRHAEEGRVVVVGKDQRDGEQAERAAEPARVEIQAENVIQKVVAP
jgi:16S rRNA G1207 methylase RsmC